MRNYDDEFLKTQGQTVYIAAKGLKDLIDERTVKDMDLYDGNFSETERKFSDVLGIPRLFIKKTYTNVQRIVIEVIDTLISDPEEIVDISSWKSVPYENREISKSLMNYRLNGNPINFYQEVYESSVDAVRSSMCVLYVYPKLETENVKVPIYAQDDLGNLVDSGETRDEEHISSYEPGFECVPPENIYVSTRATWKDYWKYPMVYKYKITRDEAKRRGYKNVDAVSPAGNEYDSDNQVKTQRNITTASPFSDDTKVKEAEEIYCFDFWDLFPGDDGRLESVNYVLLGDEHNPSVVAKSVTINELPYKFGKFETNRPPFVIGFAYPEPHKFKGKSFPEITESLQKQINADANQEREAVARALRPTTYINKDSGVDLMALVNRRIGGYVQGDGPASMAIQEIPTQNPLNITQASRARAEQDYYEHGLPPNLLGTPTNEDTATASTQQLQNANKKLQAVIKNLAYTAYIPALKYLFRLEQTYNTDKFVRMVTGRTLGWGFADDNYPAKEAIQGDLDFKLNLGINKQSQINKLLLIADRMNQANQSLFQLVQSGVVSPDQVQFKNPMRLFENLLPVLGIKNIEEFNIQALPPAPQTQGQVKGIASQPRNVVDPSSQVNQMSPEPAGLLDVIG